MADLHPAAAPSWVRRLPQLTILAGDAAAMSVTMWWLGAATATPLLVAFGLAALAASGSYRWRMNLRLGAEVFRLAAALALGVLASALVSGKPGLSTAQTIFTSGAILSVAGARALVYAVLRAARRAGRLRERAVIVGAGRVGVELARLLQERPEHGVDPVGFVDSVDDRLPLPILGSLDQIEAAIDRAGATRVIVAFSPRREAELVDLLRACARPDVEIYVVPRFFDLGAVGSAADEVWGIPIVPLERCAGRTLRWRAKRAFDVVGSAGLIVATAPLLLAAAAAVRLSSSGPVLFRQTRVGQQGRLFELLKFRTMTVNDDSDVKWTVKNDARVTKVGRVLRKTGLDELPQLFNVLRGDMTLVGPRPERPHFVERFEAEIPGYGARHRVPVGITGWAQVHGLRGDTSISDRARFDNNYVERWSFWADVLILLRTVGTLLRGQGV